MTAVIVAVIAVVVVGLAALVVVTRSRRPDGVQTFQRQIDALSPEARRQVIDEVQRLDDERGSDGGP